MRGIIIKEDYVGFTFAGKHSSQFGILSVTSGGRYSRALSPEFNDIIVNVNGSNQTHYFGTVYNRKSWQLSCAFDSITEQELREMKEWLRTDKVLPFSFDELPYIQFYAKVASPPNFQFLTFDDRYGDRVYKGELAVSFTCYKPYGYSVNKWLNNYTDASPADGNDIYLMANNVDEWSVSSRLQPRQKYANHNFDIYNNEKIEVYNAGDIPADFKLKIKLGTNRKVLLNLGESLLEITKLPNDALEIEIDTQKRLVMLKTNNGYEIANDYISRGDFFKIPISNSIKDIFELKLNTNTFISAEIDYQYCYL